ncbi:MAG: S8 family peptidase [Bacteroidia bacterium]
MFKYKTLLVIISLAFIGNGYAQTQAEFVPNQLIVKYSSADNVITSAEAFNNQILLNFIFGTDISVEKIKALGNKNAHLAVITFSGEINPEALSDQLNESSLIEFAEPNYIGYGAGVKATTQTLPDDTYFSRQYNMHNDGTFSLSPATVDADVDMDLAWDIETGDSSIVTAILDSGIKLNHPEFAGRIWTNLSEASDATDTDNNGYINDFNGWDFANEDNDPSDDHGHGTNVAGIACANGDNNLGYAGADWHSKVMSLKILNSTNSGLYSWWVDAIYYAVDNGADILNMSVGGSGFSLAMKNAVDYAYVNGVTIVACMMNFDNSVPYYPAAYANTIAVGSTDPNDERTSPFFWSATSGSSFGSHIDVCAPGNYIYGLSYSSNTNYGSYWGGTSQATPLVCGIGALLIAQDTSRGPDEIRSILRSTAEDEVGRPSEDINGFDVYHGYGRVNAHAALTIPSVGIKDDVLDNIQIYPNPASHTVVANNIQKVDHIVVYNSVGVQILEIKTSNLSQTSIDVKNLASGNYHLQFIDLDSGSSWSTNLVVTH